MRAPTEDQLAMAVDAAERMRNRDLDPHFLAHSLLYFRERAMELEDLLRHVDRYLRFGMSDQELGTIRRLVADLHRPIADDQDSTRDTLPI